MTDWIFGIIGTLLYPLFSIIFVLVDGLQNIFRIFAGVGDVKITDGGNFNTATTLNTTNSGEANETGLLFYFLNTSLVKNMLVSIVILALFLLIIFTVMAFIKNAYSAKQKSWQDIVGNAIKGLANFVVIPVCCLLGIWLGNILLNAIDGATSSGGSTSMGRKLFIACAYNANVFRTKDNLKPGDYKQFANMYNRFVGGGTELIPTTDKTDEEIIGEVQKMFPSPDIIAEEIDKMYAGNTGTKTVTDTAKDENGNKYEYSYEKDVKAPSIYDWVSVGRQYRLFEINYLVLVVGGVFMMYVMVGLTYGMIRRMFILLMLYIISPAICAMYPLDDGSAVGNWKKKFISETISAYGAVAGLNLFFSILPLVDRIEIGGGVLAPIFQLLIMVSGLFVVKEIIGMISGFIGAEDAYSKGASLRKQTKDGVKSNLKTAAAKTGAFIGGTSVAGQLARKIPFVGGTMDKAKDGMARWGTGVKRDEWKGMTDEQKQAAKDESLRDKAYARAHKEKYHRGGYEEAEKRIKEDSSLSFGERMKKLKALRGEEAENIDKYKNRGIIGAAKKVGSGVGKAGGWVKNTFGDAARAFYEESGISEYVGAGTDAYDKKLKSQASRDKRSAKGVIGENEAVDFANSLSYDPNVKRIDEMGSNVMTGLGDAIASSMYKKFAAGKLGAGALAAQSALGLDKKSSESDFKMVDTVLKRLESFSSRINSSEGDAQKKIIEEAVKFAANTDAGGNTQLQKALDDSLGKFLQAQNEATLTGVTPEISLDDTAVAGMIKASQQAGSAMAKEFRDNVKTVVKEIQEEQKKKS